MAFTIKYCEELVNYMKDSITESNWGIGDTTLTYLDSSLSEPILTKSIDSYEDKGNGEIVFESYIDYSEAVGYILTETGLLGSSSQATVSNNYGMDKNANEKYIYFYDIYIIPDESLL